MRATSGNSNPSDFLLQQMFQSVGRPTVSSGNVLNTELQNFDFANYATPARVQAAPAQAQALLNTLNGPLNVINLAGPVLAWNAAAPIG